MQKYKSGIISALGPLLMIAAGVAWSIYYVLATMNDALQDEATLALMTPLAIILIPIALFAGYSTVATLSQFSSCAETHGLNDNKRIAYLLATFLFLLALNPFGFLGASLMFFLVLSWYLGMRTLWILALVAVLLIFLIYVGFFTLLSVDLPLFWGSAS